MKRPTQKRTGTRVGRKIIASLEEAVEILERGERLEDHFTVRTVEMPDQPRAYSPSMVRSTRDRLRASQAVFAGLLGVSTKLVQSWESGDRKPSSMARRLLDEINDNPSRWLSLIRRSA